MVRNSIVWNNARAGMFTIYDGEYTCPPDGCGMDDVCVPYADVHEACCALCALVISKPCLLPCLRILRKPGKIFVIRLYDALTIS